MFGFATCWIAVARIRWAGPDSRRRSAVRLGRVHSRRAARILIKLVEDSNANVASAAADSLSAHGARVIPPLLDAHQQARKRSQFGQSDLLGKALEGAVQTESEAARTILLRAIGQYPTQDERRARAVSLLIYAPCAALVDPLIALLTDPNETVQIEALSVLAETKDPRALEHLLAAHRRGLKEATSALAALGDRRAADALLSDLPADQFRQIRPTDRHVEIIWALVRMKEPRVIPMAIGVLSSENSQCTFLRDAQPAAALAQLGDRSAVEPLRKLLREYAAKGQIRHSREIIKALVELDDPACVEDLWPIDKRCFDQVSDKIIVPEAAASLGDGRGISELLSLIRTQPWSKVREVLERVLATAGRRQPDDALRFVTEMPDLIDHSHCDYDGDGNYKHYELIHDLRWAKQAATNELERRSCNSRPFDSAQP